LTTLGTAILVASRPARFALHSRSSLSLPPMSTQVRVGLLLGLILGSAVVGVVLALLVRPTGGDSMSASRGVVDRFSRSVPDDVEHIPLKDQNGRPTDLGAFKGHTVVLADFMTSCQEVCPITTGVLLDVQHTLAQENLLGKAEIVELTVDPWRDHSERLLAYAKMIGVHWTLLTGTAGNLQKLWSWFGANYWRVPEGSPPNVDWQTGKPYSFDIDHTDDVFFLGPSGNEQALITGMPFVGGKLSNSLSDLLDVQGRQNLANPGVGAWTASDVLNEVHDLVRG
jgi:protein SCO1